MSQPQQMPPAGSSSGSGSGSKPSLRRDPPPALFMHPAPAAASPAASYVSLPSPTGGTPGPVSKGHRHSHSHKSSIQLSNDPLAAALSTLLRPGMAERGSSSSTSTTTAGPPRRRGTLPPLQTTTTTTTTAAAAAAAAAAGRRESTRAADRTDALWAEMQATLEEVELSASGGTRVFGPGHDRKLAELRAAQVALAQAWVRSEADGAIAEGTCAAPAGAPAAAAAAAAAGAKAGSVSTDKGGAAGAPGGPELRTDGTEARSSATAGPGAAEWLGQTMEEETESDIQFARQRREANDRYFQRVNQGVLDVVAKLEGVATAMRAVEQESKHVWWDESAPSSGRP